MQIDSEINVGNGLMAKKNLRINYIVFIASLVLIFLSVSQNLVFGQTIYEVNNPKREITEARPVDYRFAEDSRRPIMLNNGDEIRVVEVDKKSGKTAIFIKDGVKYEFFGGNLAFSQKNPEGTKEFFKNVNLCPNKNVRLKAFNSWHPQSKLGQFLYSPTIPVAILILVVVIWLLCTLVYPRISSRLIKGIFLLVIPVLFMCIVALEIVYFLYMGGEFIWWLDPDDVGLFSSILWSILAIITMIFQVSVFWVYKNYVAEGRKISVLPIFISFLVAFPAILIVALIVEFLAQGGIIPPEYKDTIMSLSVLAPFVISIAYSSIRNMATIGFFRGLLFSLFTVVFSIGCAVVATALVYIALKLLIMILIPLACGAIILWVLTSKTGASMMTGGNWIADNSIPDNTDGSKGQVLVKRY